jgi:ABC-type transport system involved in multi-copper enzyme maturation permease subunit
MSVELKRALWNPSMALGILLVVAILGRTYIEFWPGIGKADALYIITFPMALSGFTPFAAVFPMLPYSLSFVEEYNSGYLRLAMVRQSRISYLWKKMISVLLSGGVLMVVSFGIIFGIAIALSSPLDMENFCGMYENGIWERIAPVADGKLVLLLKLGLAFLFGAVWSSVCLLISAWIPNRYVAFVGTFVLYQFLWYAIPGSGWNPVYLLRADNTVLYTELWMPFVMQSVCLLAVLGVSGMLLWRRLKDV